jgi:hypothetical protein
VVAVEGEISVMEQGLREQDRVPGITDLSILRHPESSKREHEETKDHRQLLAQKPPPLP